MPQPTKGPRLGGSPDHQKAMLANLATSLFTHGKIHTTRAKAERLRPYAERLITKAKRGDLHNRRIIAQQIRDKDVVHRLMAEIGPFFADRPGGYTRIVKTLPRKGDNAPMAVIELVSERTATAEASQATRVASNRGTAGSGSTGSGATGSAATGAAATAATLAAAESESGSSEAEDSTEATEATGATEATQQSGQSGQSEASDVTDEADVTAVPEEMAENAAANAGLDTEDEDGSSSTGSTESGESGDKS